MRTAHMSRRAVLGSAAVALAATAAGLGVAAQAQATGSGPSPRGYAFLDAAMDGYPTKGSTRLAQSYTDQPGLFSSAFVYDNALAILGPGVGAGPGPVGGRPDRRRPDPAGTVRRGFGVQPARHRFRVRLLPVPARRGDRVVPAGRDPHESPRRLDSWRTMA
jgi:hypothetical protein